MVTLKQVSKVYERGGDHICALDHVSLDVEAGAFCAFVGPSGCGKSTLLNLIPAAEPTIQLAVMLTVMLSILAHGFSAMPGMALYARRVSALPPNAPELGSAKA